MTQLFCLDVGNTHAHHGVLAGGVTLAGGQIPTARLLEPEAGLGALLARARTGRALDGAAFCSVVPALTARIRALLDAAGLPVWHLRHDTCPGLGIHYPRPAEIGHDRLANCLGAQVTHGAPAVVMDMGTTVNFDILTARGFEGGVIAPGLGIMTRYLHEQTAQLPVLDPADLMVSEGVGKSTLEAMRLGCAVGFAGMIDALLGCVLAQMEKWGAPTPALIATGGTAGMLPRAWRHRMSWEPDITLRGLEVAFLRGLGR
ncbi:MAG: type III pantothenate kinase [Puniceicoccales bacterium]|nr:type III pantothenate kinase [Puniceicoccales bacterium]